MTEYFNYNTNGIDAMTAPSPLWSDFDINSKFSKQMIKAKEDNDENYWTLMREVFAHDLETLPLERFKMWASVNLIPFMSTNKNSNYIRIVLDAVSHDRIYLEALVENMIGLTKKDFNQFSIFNDIPTTMNRIQHLAHLIICGYTPEALAKMDTIVELGAGIGEMADIVYKLGFKGKYIIYDFPEVGQIQKWYHDKSGLTSIVHTSEIDDLVAADLCIATWSLTEMPLDLRDQIIGKIINTKNWLIAYSNLIFGIDNAKYIAEEFIPQFTKHDVEYIDIPFMPWDGGTKYLTIKHKP